MMAGLIGIGMLEQMATHKLKWIYSGEHTTRILGHGGVDYLEICITGSGILTVTGSAEALVWLCGGGASGQRPTMDGYKAGGAGAYATDGWENVLLDRGIITVAIGAGGATSTTASFNAGGASSFGSFFTANGASNENGGTGGGVAQFASSKGDGLSKLPFNDNEAFPELYHCPGGGSGAGARYDGNQFFGGKGGTNGGNGGQGGWGSTIPGEGGAYGGGRGGTPFTPGGSAAFFGGGGGGGYQNYAVIGNGGAGYQGVIYIRIPLSEVA